MFIMHMPLDRCFICGDADGEEYGLDEIPGGGFTVFKR